MENYWRWEITKKKRDETILSLVILVGAIFLLGVGLGYWWRMAAVG